MRYFVDGMRFLRVSSQFFKEGEVKSRHIVITAVFIGDRSRILSATTIINAGSVHSNPPIALADSDACAIKNQ